ncbi:MAG TPA: Nif3-like dinuclear metal center hexameric protein, partial [Verrucomicrobiales bacterium]|nr:Nif3-like dinuclear metal center hexameric protein [Verrucomicrobiales bacterium]
MAKAKLADIVAHCNRTLKPDSFEDWPGAVNGLQVENRGSVSRIAAAVDATPATVKKAADEGADLLIVHHGLFWGKTHPWTGNRFKLLRLLLDNNIAVYSSHLPLDAHPRLGNNAGLCRALGIRSPKPFFIERGQAIGLRGELDITRAGLAKRLAK